MRQFLKRKCTGTYQISISISEAIKVGGNMKYVIWGNRGERKSQIPRLISLPVSAPFLVQYAPKILYILMVMFMMGFYPLFCPSRVRQEEGWWWVLLHFLFPLQGTSAQSFSPRPFCRPILRRCYKLIPFNSTDQSVRQFEVLFLLQGTSAQSFSHPSFHS